MKNSNIAVETTLSPEHLLHLTMARNWLAIGEVEEARREFELLPNEVRIHAQAQGLREQLRRALALVP